MPAPTPAFFVADSAGLDFLNSIATPLEAPVDWLGDRDGFVAWLRQAELVPEADLDTIVDRAMPGELDRVADQARDLRACGEGASIAGLRRSLWGARADWPDAHGACFGTR